MFLLKFNGWSATASYVVKGVPLVGLTTASGAFFAVIRSDDPDLKAAWAGTRRPASSCGPGCRPGPTRLARSGSRSKSPRSDKPAPDERMMPVDTINLNQIAPNRGVANTNYFNGRILAAEDLPTDQAARRLQVAQLGQAVGAGCGLWIAGLRVDGVGRRDDQPDDERDGRGGPSGQPPGPAAGAAGRHRGGAYRHDAARADRRGALRRLSAAAVLGRRRHRRPLRPDDRPRLRLRRCRAGHRPERGRSDPLRVRQREPDRGSCVPAGWPEPGHLARRRSNNPPDHQGPDG